MRNELHALLRDQDWKTPFERDGFVIVPDVLNGEELQRLREDIQNLNPPSPGELPGALEHLSHWIHLLDRPALLAPVLQLLGAQIHLVHSSIASIPPDSGSMVWHEDGPRPWSYPEVDGKRALVLLRVGLPLSPVSGEEHGQLMVIPGSHRMPFPHPDDAEAIWERADIRKVEIPPGGVVLFHNGLWHTTAPNRLPVSRTQLYFVFAPLWHKGLDYSVLPERLDNAVSSLPGNRQALVRQLLGDLGGQGGVEAMFPDETAAPALRILQPEKPASGA